MSNAALKVSKFSCRGLGLGEALQPLLNSAALSNAAAIFAEVEVCGVWDWVQAMTTGWDAVGA